MMHSPALSLQTCAASLPGGAALHQASVAADHSHTDHSLHSHAQASREAYGAGAMSLSLSNTNRRDHGDSRKTSSRPAKRQHQDFLTEQANKLSLKEGEEFTGMSGRAFENLRLGRNKISFDSMMEWMMRDPDFAAAVAEYVGLIRPGEAEFAGALTRAFNAYQRRP